MNLIDIIFWFRGGKESVSIVATEPKITTFTFENAEVSDICVNYANNINEVSLYHLGKYYKFFGAEHLPKVARAFKKKGAKDKVLFSAILEVEDYEPNRAKGRIVKVSKVK